MSRSLAQEQQHLG